MRLIQKPDRGEFPSYASMYIDLVPGDGMLLEHLTENLAKARELILKMPSEKLGYAYASGKWTIKEILVHIIDDERIYAYRALRFARNDGVELPGFDQDEFVRFSEAKGRPIDSILEEYETVRNSTIALFNGFPENALKRGGVANGNFATVRALGYHIAGHELHHLNIITEKYL